MLKAPRLDRMLFWTHEIKYLDKNSKKIFDEIFDLIAPIKPLNDNNYRELWLTAERGTRTEINKFLDKEDRYTKEEFNQCYPNMLSWYKFGSIDVNGFRIIQLRSLKFIVEEGKFVEIEGYNYTEILSWLKSAIEDALTYLREGTYNQRVEEELPYELRYGVMLRKDYWRELPEIKREVLKGISEEDIERFLNYAESEGNNYVPSGRISSMTFNKYFDIAYCAYKMAGWIDDEESPEKHFFRHCEDFGGGVIYHLNYASVEEFEHYYKVESHNYGGHPWGIVRGSSRSRIMLYPRKMDDGYYFEFTGNPNWSIFEIVKLYLGLKDNNVPVVLLNKDEIFAYLREEDYVGFVPETDIPVYCQLKFKHHKVDDFRHYNPEIHSKILNKIEWQEYDKIELIEETV